SQGEYVLILDADFIPIIDALHDLIPYIASDNKIGILQTPQYFEQTKQVHKRSHVEYGGGNIVEDFYRIIMPCRDEFKAAMCVGTSAIYRKSAIQKLQGTPKVHASEDLATGLLVTQHGYYVKYLPLIVSMGKSPDTYQGYFKQHMRWCSGNLVFAKYWPSAHLSLPARLIYLINPMHYLSEALTIVFAFQFLALLYFHSDSLSIAHTFYFLPYIILSKCVSPLIKTHKSKIGTKFAALNNSYTYLYTYFRMIVKGIPTWHPTGIKIAGLHDDFVQAFNIAMFISATYVMLFIVILLFRPEVFGNYNTYIVLGWSLYSVLWHTMFLTFIMEFMHPYRLATARNVIYKAVLYIKRYLMFLLFFILGTIAVTHTVLAFLNPTSPTVLALSGLQNSDQQQHVSNTMALIPSPTQMAQQQNVVSSSTSANTLSLPESKRYIYTVERGDSYIKLAKKALREFAAKENLSLTQKQIDAAGYVLYLNADGNIRLRTGETVAFQDEAIIHALADAVKH
ncbi:MAG TPA: glycosyltransferase, partial [Patescibacteria group bacterium]|nr:glycosyltransferase [Patescibacteria group bacterium]